MILNQRLGPNKKRDGQAGNKNCAEQARDGEAQKIEAAAFLAQAVAKNAPAEPERHPRVVMLETELRAIRALSHDGEKYIFERERAAFNARNPGTKLLH